MSKVKRVVLITGAVGILLSGSSRAQDERSIELEVVSEGPHLVVRNVSSGGSIAIVGYALFNRGGFTRHLRLQELIEDADDDGEVRYDLGVELPLRSVVVVVDLESGRHALSRGSGVPTPSSLQVAPGLDFGPSESLNDLVHHQARSELWLIRPKVGLWTLTTFAGSSLDRQPGAGGRVHVGLEDLRSVGGAETRLEKAQEGDVFLALHPLSLEHTFVALDSASEAQP